MGHHRSVQFIAVVLAVGLLSGTSPGQEMLRREISGSAVKELNVSIDLSFGHATLKRGTTKAIAVIEYTKPEEDDYELDVHYSVDEEVGSLVIRSEEESSFWDRSDKEHREWMIELTDRVPLSLSFKLGAGEGELDLTGLQLHDIKISTGASAVRLTCDEPNRIRANTIDIESGVSKLTAQNLCNTNFRRMRFSGGVGTYVLDFGGRLMTDAEVTIEVGLGAVTVYLPEDVPTRIKHDDSWFSSFDLDHDFLKKSKGMYESAAFGISTTRLVIAIESGLGSVKVRRR
jgi:hypothetical protein